LNNIIRLKAVLKMTGLSRSSVYSMMGKGCFPTNVSIGARAVGWVESEVRNWIDSRISASRI
jgi:prophage regulatory protein